jgi:hypothetical protein
MYLHKALHNKEQVIIQSPGIRLSSTTNTLLLSPGINSSIAPLLFLSGDIGSAIHRIVIKSIFEIVQSIRNGMKLSKSEVMDVFSTNAHEEVDVNWKFYMLSGIENPLPMITEDLNVRADRLANQLTTVNSYNNSYEKLILRPEFTISVLSLGQHTSLMAKPRGSI